ncbi:MAG: hypothetical protein AB8G11_01315 [Saprospiraceae bacterium]
MINTPINLVTNCNEHLETKRLDCYVYTFENKTDYPINLSFREIGGNYLMAFDIQSGEIFTHALPNDGMYEVKYSILQYESDNEVYYDYLFEMCKFLDCVENMIFSFLCESPIDPCEIIKKDCLEQVEMNGHQKITQINHLFMLYQLYLVRIFNFKNYWMGVSNTTVVDTAELEKITFLVKRINAFIKNCNLNCEEQCKECN